MCITDTIDDFDVCFVLVFTDDTVDENAQEISVNPEGHLDIQEFNGSIRTVRLPEVTSNQAGWFHIDI